MIGLGLQYIGFCGEVGGDDLLVVCKIVGAVAAVRNIAPLFKLYAYF